MGVLTKIGDHASPRQENFAAEEPVWQAVSVMCALCRCSLSLSPSLSPSRVCAVTVHMLLKMHFSATAKTQFQKRG